MRDESFNSFRHQIGLNDIKNTWAKGLDNWKYLEQKDFG